MLQRTQFRLTDFGQRISWSAEGRRFQDNYLVDYRRALDTRPAELAEIEPDPDWDPKHWGT